MLKLFAALLFLAQFIWNGPRAFEHYLQQAFDQLDWDLRISQNTEISLPNDFHETDPDLESIDKKIQRLESPVPLWIEGDKVQLLRTKFLEEMNWLLEIYKDPNPDIKKLALKKARSLIRVYSRLSAIDHENFRPEILESHRHLAYLAEGIHKCGLNSYSLKIFALLEAQYWREQDLDVYACYEEIFNIVSELPECACLEYFTLDKNTVLEGINEIFWGKPKRWYWLMIGDHQRLTPNDHSLSPTFRFASTWRNNKEEEIHEHSEMAPLCCLSLLPLPNMHEIRMLDLLELTQLLWTAASDPILTNTLDMKIAIIDAMMQSLHTYGTNNPSCKQGTQNRLALALQHLHPLVSTLHEPWTPSQFWSHFHVVAESKAFMVQLKKNAPIWLLSDDWDFTWRDMSHHLAQELASKLNLLPYSTAYQFLLELDQQGRESVRDYLLSTLQDTLGAKPK